MNDEPRYTSTFHAHAVPGRRLARAACVLALGLTGLNCDVPDVEPLDAEALDAEDAEFDAPALDAGVGEPIQLDEALMPSGLDLAADLDDESMLVAGGFDPWMYTSNYFPFGAAGTFEGYVYDQNHGATNAGCPIRTSRLSPMKYYPNTNNPCPSTFEVLGHANNKKKIRLLSIPNNDGYRYLASVLAVQKFPAGNFPFGNTSRWPHISKIAGVAFKLRALTCGGSNPAHMFGRIAYNINLTSPDGSFTRTISVDLLTSVGASVDQTKMSITPPGKAILTEADLFVRSGGSQANIKPYMYNTYEMNAPAHGFGARTTDLYKTLQTRPACPNPASPNIDTAPEWDVWIPFDHVLKALHDNYQHMGNNNPWPTNVTQWNLYYSGGLVAALEYWGAQHAWIEVEMKEHRVVLK